MLIRQNEGVLLQVVPNIAGDNTMVNQLIGFIHDISNTRPINIKQQKGKKIRQKLKDLYERLTQHPFVVSYEIYSDEKETTFNFWIPKEIKDSFIKKIYSVWDGSQVKIIEKDPVEFDITKATFATVKFSQQSILPLNIEDKDINPLTLLIQHLENLEGEDKVLVQFLMKPEKYKWQASGLASYAKLKNGQSIPNNKVRDALLSLIEGVFGGNSDTPERLLQKEAKLKPQKMLSKLNQSGINVNIRVAAQSDNEQRSKELISGVYNAFKVLEANDAAHNKFVRRDLLPFQHERFYQQMKERRTPIVTINHKDIWVTPEIAKILCQPDPNIQSNKMERVTVRQTKVDDDLKQCSGLRMGLHTYNGKNQMLYWDTIDMDTVMRPKVVIANPGEGKTEMLINSFFDWIELGYGGAVIDVADGKLIDKILYKLPNKFKDDVYLIDANDLENPPAISDFSEAKGGDREVSNLLSQMWTEFFVHFFGIEDHHRSKDFIRKSSVPTFSFEGNTMLEQYNMIANDDFRAEMIEKMTGFKRLFRYKVWWEKFNAKPVKVKQEETKAILNKFELIMDNEILKNIICQKNNKIPKFRDLMDQRKIILVKASEGIGYGTSRVLGALLLMKFWMAALSRSNQEVRDRVPFKVFCDEPQNYIASANYVKEMLAKSRKYRLGLELYFQDPIQIEEQNKGLLKLLVSMNPHLILGKMGSDPYKKYFKDRIHPLQPAEGAVLPRYHWIVSIYKDKEAVKPFIIEAPPMVLDPTDLEIAARKAWVNELKRRTSTPVEEVEEDIILRELPELADYDEEGA